MRSARSLNRSIVERGVLGLRDRGVDDGPGGRRVGRCGGLHQHLLGEEVGHERVDVERRVVGCDPVPLREHRHDLGDGDATGERDPSERTRSDAAVVAALHHVHDEGLAVDRLVDEARGVGAVVRWHAGTHPAEPGGSATLPADVHDLRSAIGRHRHVPEPIGRGSHIRTPRRRRTAPAGRAGSARRDRGDVGIVARDASPRSRSTTDASTRCARSSPPRSPMRAVEDSELGRMRGVRRLTSCSSSCCSRDLAAALQLWRPPAPAASCSAVRWRCCTIPMRACGRRGRRAARRRRRGARVVAALEGTGWSTVPARPAT